jgi:hypothetical protein
MSSPSSFTHLHLVRDLTAWDRTIRALANHSVSDLLDLVVGGEVLPLSPDTDLVVEEDFATLVRVRVLSGESRGISGWLPSGLLQRAKAA